MPDIVIPTFSDSYLRKPINLDITNKCPLQCPACHRQLKRYVHLRYNYFEMSVEDFKKILKTFSWIEFSGQQSDPTTHSQFHEFLSLSYNHKLDIHTAASHRKKDFYKEAYERTGLDTSWIFGLDGLPEESHKHRINQDGEHLFEMMKLGRKMNVNIVWQYIVFKYNQNDIDTAKKIAIDNNIEFKLSYSSRWSGEMSKLKPDEKYCA